ncbi:hypothetical protein [Parafrankia sp. CH37]|uniref:hypothetical protein n=1 Tax=Parafrankia sp. CH37 TaxID=683308 RepID=UPI001041C1B7|nr:hypothetical protein [Parafrankia sp. CH37]
MAYPARRVDRWPGRICAGARDRHHSVIDTGRRPVNRPVDDRGAGVDRMLGWPGRPGRPGWPTVAGQLVERRRAGR